MMPDINGSGGQGSRTCRFFRGKILMKRVFLLEGQGFRIREIRCRTPVRYDESGFAHADSGKI